MLKPYVKCVAEGEVSIVEERVGSDADRALEAAQIAWWGGWIFKRLVPPLPRIAVDVTKVYYMVNLISDPPPSSWR